MFALLSIWPVAALGRERQVAATVGRGAAGGQPRTITAPVEHPRSRYSGVEVG
jgi:hypothetical protein